MIPCEDCITLGICKASISPFNLTPYDAYPIISKKLSTKCITLYNYMNHPTRDIVKMLNKRYEVVKFYTGLEMTKGMWLYNHSSIGRRDDQ